MELDVLIRGVESGFWPTVRVSFVDYTLSLVLHSFGWCTVIAGRAI